MNIHDATEIAYKNGQKDIIKKVKQYLLDCLDEWQDLDDRKYDLPNIQVYNHIRKCLDDLEELQKHI